MISFWWRCFKINDDDDDDLYITYFVLFSKRGIIFFRW